MNILFIGLGSIGQRHLRIVNKIYPNAKIFAYRKLNRQFVLNDNNKIVGNNLEKKYKIKVIKSFKNIKNFNINLAFVCTPPVFSLKFVKILIRNKINFLVEKPLSNNTKDLKLIYQLNKKYKNYISTGFQLRFSNTFIKLKKILKQNIGKICRVTVDTGEDLKLLHVFENYKNIYASKKKLGGGVVLTFIHDIDIIRNLFGDPIKVFSFISKKSNYKIDVEDTLSSILIFKKKANSFPIILNLNFIERPKKREISILTNKCKIECNFYKPEIRIRNFNTNKTKLIKLKKENRNNHYLKEIKNLITSIKNKKKPESDLLNGIKNIYLAEKLKNFFFN